MKYKIKKKLDQIYLTNSSRKEYRNKTSFNEEIGSSIYGEITKKGTNSIINKFKEYFNQNTVFYDLGSGLGKMVIHVGIQCGVKKSIGIEYSKERHKGAMYLKEKYAFEHSNIYFYNKLFQDQDLSDATVIYVDNTVLSREIMDTIYKMVPKGCLFLYKKPIHNIDLKYQNIDTHLVERTYKQTSLGWIIKK